MLLTKVLKDELKKASFISARTGGLIDDIVETTELHLQSPKTNLLWGELLRDAVVYLKKKDSRETIHDEMTLGLDYLFDYLKEYCRFEQILYGAWPNYRDHVAHALRVMLLGDSIIRDVFGFKNVATPLQEKLPVSDDEKEAMWIIMALTHDLGLPLEGIRMISDRVRQMLYKFGMVSVEELTSGYFSQFGNLSEFVIRFVSSDVRVSGKKFVLHTQAKYYQKFLSALSSFNHGVVSSIILMRSLVYFKESDFMIDPSKPLVKEDARQFLIRNQILRTIASHGCDDIYHLSITNFPFILTLCDEMQEWGRPRLVDVTKRAGSEAELWINKIEEKLVDYKIRFYYPTNTAPSEEEKKIVTDEIQAYFVKKSTKWLNVLRSAVSPPRKRKIELNFEVSDETRETGMEPYLLRHKNPENVEIKPDYMVKRIYPDLTWEV